MTIHPPKHLHMVSDYDYPPPPGIEPDDLSAEFSDLGRNPGLSALSLPLYGAVMFGLGVLAHWAWP